MADQEQLKINSSVQQNVSLASRAEFVRLNINNGILYAVTHKSRFYGEDV